MNMRPHNERGASMVEYALLVALIAVVAFISVELFGEAVYGSYSSTSTDVASAMN